MPNRNTFYESLLKFQDFRTVISKRCKVQATLCDKFCQRLMEWRGFYLGTMIRKITYFKIIKRCPNVVQTPVKLTL